jgi:hypothetical protein
MVAEFDVLFEQARGLFFKFNRIVRNVVCNYIKKEVLSEQDM